MEISLKSKFLTAGILIFIFTAYPNLKDLTAADDQIKALGKRAGANHSVNKSKNKSFLKTGDLIGALKALQDHIEGKRVLDAAEIDKYKKIIEKHPKLLGRNDKTIHAAFAVVRAYDKVYGPLFVNDIKLKRVGDAGHLKPTATDIHWAVFTVMQQIIKGVYTSNGIAKFADLIDGYKFACSKDFPGEVDPPSNPKAVYTVKVNASYPPLKGRTGDKFAREATGAYLAPGSIATVTVPDSLVDKGFMVRVGGHSRVHLNTRMVRRLIQISRTYPITKKQVRVANPLGGGIYIEVPIKADAGIVEVSIQNAVRSPYFSAKSFDKTTNKKWCDVERNQPAPWADFQSDRFMMLVPSSWIRKLDDPVSLIADWDKAMDVCNDLMGLPQVHGREWLYITVDQQPMITGQMKPGYPTCNQGYDPKKDYHGLADNFLIRDPQYAPSYVFHELGHDYRFVKFSGDEETAVNLLFTAVLNKGFGVDIDTAFSKSKDKRPFSTIDHAAMAWMTCTTFGKGLPMSLQLQRYQSQGFAKYVDIARLFGWDVLESFWKKMNQDYEIPARDRVWLKNDELILRLSKAAGTDLTPLLKFWGAHPEKPDELKNAIQKAKLPKSAKVYDTLERYKKLPPADNAAFRKFAKQWWGNKLKRTHMNLQSKTEHIEQLTAYNEKSAETIRKVVQNIIDEYFPDGRPKDK